MQPYRVWKMNNSEYRKTPGEEIPAGLLTEEEQQAVNSFGPVRLTRISDTEYHAYGLSGRYREGLLRSLEAKGVLVNLDGLSTIKQYELAPKYRGP